MVVVVVVVVLSEMIKILIVGGVGLGWTDCQPANPPSIMMLRFHVTSYTSQGQGN